MKLSSPIGSRPRRTRPGTAGFLLLLLSLGACAAGDRPAPPPRAGDALPALEATGLDGQLVTLDQYRGQAVLLNLWATWCPPCRAEMPYFQELAEEYADRGLAVVGVSVDDRGAREVLDAFLEESGVEYDILLDPAMVSMDILGVLGLPATFLVNPEGVVTHMRAGPVMEGDQSFIDQLEAILP